MAVKQGYVKFEIVVPEEKAASVLKALMRMKPVDRIKQTTPKRPRRRKK